METVHKAILPVILSLLIIPSLAYGATIFPQFEKIELVEKLIEQENLLTINNQFEKQTNGPQKDWERTVYKVVGSSFGLLLPHPSNPDSRDISTYVKANQGNCSEEIENGFEEVGRICRHVMSIAQIEVAGMHFEDMFRVSHYPGKNTGIHSPDLFHERASACSNIQYQIDMMWGKNFDFDDPKNKYDKMLRDGFIGKRIQGIENNLSPEYKLALKDHIETNTFVDFYTSEVKVTHPTGVMCDLT